MYVGHDKVEQLCNFTNKADEKGAKDDRSEMKVKQGEETVDEIIFDL
jgi:hypothetical protein